MAENRINFDPTFTTLIDDVVTEVGELAAAHGQQLREEVTDQATRARNAALVQTAGVMIACIGLAFLLVALVRVLIDSAGWTPAAAWVVVGAATVVTAGIMLAIGHAQWRAFRPFPQETLQSVKESFSWIIRR